MSSGQGEVKMTNLTSRNSEPSDEENSALMEKLWGGSWKRLNLKQRQLVGEVLCHLNQTDTKAEDQDF